MSTLTARTSYATATTQNRLDGITLQRLTPHNFDDVWKTLLPHQAEVHGAKLSDDRDSLYKTLFSSDDSERILEGITMYKDGKPIGYMLFSTMYGPEGKTLYLEDNCVIAQETGSGLGAFLLQAVLTEAAKARGCDVIACTVDMTRDHTRNFYESRGNMHAEKLPRLDMGAITIVKNEGSIILKKDGQEPLVLNVGFPNDEVRLVTSDDVAQFRQENDLDYKLFAGNVTVGAVQLAQTMENALNDSRSMVIGSFNEAGSMTAVTIGSKTFSTFGLQERLNLSRTVAISPQPPDVTVILSHVAFARYNGAFTRMEVQPAVKVFGQRDNGHPLLKFATSLMTDDPNSVELGYAAKIGDMLKYSHPIPADLANQIQAVSSVPRASAQRGCALEAHVG